MKLISTTEIDEEYGWKCSEPVNPDYPYPHRLHVSKKGENYTINFDGSIMVITDQNIVCLLYAIKTLTLKFRQ